MKPLVILESPYRGQTLREDLRNVLYARRALKDCIDLGEAPIASHLLFPQILNDHKPEERALGIEAGTAWFRVADYIIFYMDYGMSVGMKAALELAQASDKRTVMRTIGQNVD